MTEQDYEKAKPLVAKLELFFKCGTWLHSQTDNNNARELWIKYFGNEQQFNEITSNGCARCNPYKRIYQDIYRLWKTL